MVLALGGGAFIDPETRAPSYGARRVGLAARRSGDAGRPHRAQARHAAAARARRPARDPGDTDAGALSDLRRKPTTRSIRRSSPTSRWSNGYWRWSSPGASGMTSEARTLRVALGERGYPITIGAGLIERADELLAPLTPLRRTVIVTDENLARTAHPRRLAAALERAGIASRTLVLPAGRKHQELAVPRAGGRRVPGIRRRAPLGGRRAGRRRDRRPGRASRPPSPCAASTSSRSRPRSWRRSTARSAARPSINSRARQEPDRSLPPAQGRADRHRPCSTGCPCASCARAMPRSPSTA